MKKADYLFILNALIDSGNLTKNQKGQVGKLIDDLDNKIIVKKSKKTNKPSIGPKKKNGRKIREFTDDEKTLIRQKLSDGISLSQIRLEMNCGYSTLKRFIDTEKGQ